MTMEEKLQHFYDNSVEEAKRKADQEIEAHRAAMEQMLKEHKEARKAGVEAEIKAEAENARREVNKALSAEQLSLKRDWTKKQNDLKEKLFVEVKEHLEQFMDTPEYEEFLYKKIMEAKKFAGDDEIDIYLSSEDTAHLRSLTAKTGLPIRISEEAFMGGIKAMIPKKNILIDNSFLETFHTMYKEFKFDGGRA